MRSKFLLSLTPVGVICVAALGMPSATAATGSSDYQATLNAVNQATGSGTLTLSLDGNKATVTQRVSGLAEKFAGAAYPHVQHIHGKAQGVCPPASADKDGDDVVSTTEGAPSYGPIVTTLHKTGDTSPAAGTNIKTAPSGGSYSYSRTITLSPEAVKAVKGNTAVIVVHGLDPTTLSKKAQAAKSDLVPSLPLAATSPALCGKLTSMASGGVDSGGGSTSGAQDANLYAIGGGLLLAAGATMVVRRRLTQ